ncbi:MAG: DUF3291 domain-containing protein [Pseudomonadota bacterium]
MQLAEVNIAEWKVPQDSPEARTFLGAIDKVNAVAERSPGFVWRLTDPGVHDPWRGQNVIVNLSVWESPKALENYVWNTVHRAIYRKKEQWFSAMRMAHFAMWWVDTGHRPNLIEAKDRLDHMHAHGNSDRAFGWEHLPHIKLWQNQRCG